VEVDGARLRWKRQERGLTMQELGTKAGVNPVTVGRLEKRRGSARLSTVRKLAGALEVVPAELLVRW
jgi:transcriptional regulator with XRE-family HTH domain